VEPPRDVHANICALRISTLAWRKIRPSFIELVDWTKLSQCTDPRDRVFALLSLASESQSWLLVQPDYSRSASDIYRDVVVNHIKQTKTLKILCSVEFQNLQTDMPSWVPDWTNPRLSEILSMQIVAINSQFNGEIEGSTLRAAGIHVGLVDHIESASIPTTMIPAEIMDEILRLAGTLNLEDTTTLPEFMSAICTGMFADSFFPASWWRSALPTLAQCLHSFHEFQSDPHYCSSDTIKFLNVVFDATSNRLVFTTSDGRICLGPRAVEVGDVVAVLLGCDSPLVLRPNGLGQFKVIGEAYCHGVMQGEALLGPFDSMWKQAWRPREGIAVHDIVFINTETGEFSALDPRLGPLPSGWNSHCTEGRRWYYWPDGAKKMFPFDPRLIRESLKQRGVEVRDFEIV
jgi:hypothetical protein